MVIVFWKCGSQSCPLFLRKIVKSEILSVMFSNQHLPPHQLSCNDEMDGNITQRWGIRLTKKFKKPNLSLFVEVQNIIPTINRNERVTGNYLMSGMNRAQFTSFQAGLFYKFGRLKSDPSIKESKSGQNDRL